MYAVIHVSFCGTGVGATVLAPAAAALLSLPFSVAPSPELSVAVVSVSASPRLLVVGFAVHPYDSAEVDDGAGSDGDLISREWELFVVVIVDTEGTPLGNSTTIPAPSVGCPGETEEERPVGFGLARDGLAVGGETDTHSNTAPCRCCMARPSDSNSSCVRRVCSTADV